MKSQWFVSSEEESTRLLNFLKQKLEGDFSIRELRYFLDHQHCQVNGQTERFGSYRLKKNDQVVLFHAAVPEFHFDTARILYEEEGFFAYDKPPGIDSEKLSKILKVPLVHRLDRDTSGVLLFAKEKSIKQKLELLFLKRKIKKTYLAVTLGRPSLESGSIKKPIKKIKEGVMAISKDGLYAETSWVLEKQTKEFSLLKVFPKTGRTHQIRLHLASLGHPIFGDLTYGKRDAKNNAHRILLHALSVEFVHPVSEKIITIHSPMPEDMKCLFT